MPTITDKQFDEVLAILDNAGRMWRELNGAIGHQVNQSTAYRQYGRVRVNRWTREGKVQPVKQGNRIYYDAYDLLKSSKENQL